MIKKTLYFGNPARLSLRDGQIVIEKPDAEKRRPATEVWFDEARVTRPVEDVGVVVLDHPQITLTSVLMEALLESNCALITCDGRHLPVGLLLPLYGNTTQNERFRQQIDASVPLRKQLWQQTVRAKIRNQAVVLRAAGVEAGCMEAWARDVRSGDPDNLEARAAAYYWKWVFRPRQGFIRDREGEYPNGLLNYGYAILRAVVARSLVVSGLLPTLGIHHHNRYNAYCLADDVMEPYRPFVDKVVVGMALKDEGYELTPDVKRQLLSIPTLDVLLDGRRSPLMVAAGLTASSLNKCFSGELRHVLYPEWP